MTGHDQRLPDLEPLTVGERLDAMIDTVHRAETEGVLSVLPSERSEVRSSELLASRIVTVRTRLHLLGYLREDSQNPELDAGLRDALRRFQTEAGLVVDGWFGPQTWSALEQLVDFESGAEIEHWLARPEASGALTRAIRLRLHVLGLLDSRTVRSQRTIDEGLARFATAAWMLGVTHGRLRPDTSAETLAVLFDLDRISRRLAEGGTGFAFRRPPELSEAEALSLARRFIVCVAGIELWLLGFDVDLDGTGRLLRPTTHHYAASRFPMFHALVSFWRSRGRSGTEARAKARRVDGAFFIELAAVAAEAHSAGPELDSEQVYQEIVDLDHENRATVWDQMRGLGSRIWDGVKRVWRFIRSLLARAGSGLKALVAWTRDLARLAYRYALASFSAVRRATLSSASAVRFILSSPLPGSDPAHLVIQRDRDLDLTLVLATTHDPAVAGALAATLRRHGQAFHASVHVLSRLIALLMKVITTLTMASGWFGLILALARLFRELRRLAATERSDLELLDTAARAV